MPGDTSAPNGSRPPDAVGGRCEDYRAKPTDSNPLEVDTA
jgi:hypothetical protein